ncbi:EF-hand domain-containing protein [Rhodoplanes sp. TEM]|uniref:EF-hand domain-containing protein n=1 Tax=Rhodoplanes tepidamans TaxID=200616 RepID=A0ABT5JG22_RHOTP|nr:MULTISPECIES: EF-hand domain-containing protein [Rhodoplanes]MDC7788254.1 EF-hand domain-containing protein [Rhodoplanes tepidamans]MDC7982941.1 EF-hand domain-containing protein [Rhodoplanes sp. TEM]MDQ0355878.1 Ca2+-binding EF-hand superfamily protein [Rhodoplanes tepidamans]
MAESIVSTLDSDGDGAISESELETFVTENGGTASDAEAMLESLDTDRDGSVSTDELSSQLESLHASMQGPPPPPPSDATSSTSTSSTTATAA